MRGVVLPVKDVVRTVSVGWLVVEGSCVHGGIALLQHVESGRRSFLLLDPPCGACVFFVDSQILLQDNS